MKNRLFLLATLAFVIVSVTGYGKNKAKITKEFRKNLKQAENMNTHDPRVHELIQRIRNQEAVTHRRVDTIVCYGIGALVPGSSLTREHNQVRQAPDQLGPKDVRLLSHFRQLDLCNRLKREFGVSTEHAFFADPIFVDTEYQLIEAMGFTRDRHGDCSFRVGRRGLTIAYTPGLPAQLSENLLRANWSPDRLPNLIYIGTDIVHVGADVAGAAAAAPADHDGDYMCWEYVQGNGIARIWSGQPSREHIFDVLVTFELTTRFLPSQVELFERSELQAFTSKVAEVKPDFEELRDILNSDGIVSHMVVYGLGHFLALNGPRTEEIDCNRIDMSVAIAIRELLNADGIFYAATPLTGFEQQVLYSHGFVTERDNQLRHSITDYPTMTLVFVYGDHEYWDDILVANWSPEQLHALIVISDVGVNAPEYVFWAFLAEEGAVQTYDYGELILYKFTISNNLLVEFDMEFPSAEEVLSFRFVEEGGYANQETKGASLQRSPPPSPPSHMINRLGRDAWPKPGGY